MQIIQFSHVRDYEEPRPEDVYFLLGKRNHDNGKRAQNVLETAKTFEGLPQRAVRQIGLPGVAALTVVTSPLRSVTCEKANKRRKVVRTPVSNSHR